MNSGVLRITLAVVLAVVLVLSGCGGTAGTSLNAGGGSDNGGNAGTPPGGGTPPPGGGTPPPGGGPTPPPGGGTPTGTATINVVNHVIIMMQENRSFDHYFWKMTDYRQRNNIPINSSDGKIKDASDPDAAKMFTNNISPAAGAIKPYHAGSQCTEDLTPDWAESHKEMDRGNPAGAGPNSPMNGFASTAYFLGQYYQVLADKTGRRAMSYFDDNDLNYYYFMASQFALGDMFFSPVPTRTSSNRLYIHAATSGGSVHADTTTSHQFGSKTIWRELDEKGISFKIYLSDWGVKDFTFFQFFSDFNNLKSHVVSIDEYFADVQNGTLPSVAFIETGMNTGRDEHPTNNPGPGVPVPAGQAIRVQQGALWTSKVINALMQSQSWKDSVFFWMFDEGGGAFDHVPPISVPNPDGIRPNDLDASKDCLGRSCGSFDFNITGFRVPNFVVSPFAKKNYVSHTPMDYTAVLKFIETRWGLPPLTKRDAAMPDMTEFFDFNAVPWATPPTPPAQHTNMPCDFNRQ